MLLLGMCSCARVAEVIPGVLHSSVEKAALLAQQPSAASPPAWASLSVQL